jgi:phosphonate transport system substrate-binding protein
MRSKGIVCLLIQLLFLTACQPQIALVEVTRLVEAPSASGSADTASVNAAAVEVTRVVPQVVTQVVAQEVIVEVTKSPLGSAERPVQLLFAPTVSTAVITGRGEALIQALSEATGLAYEIGVMDDEQSMIGLMCDAPMETIGFLSAVGYVQANEQCSVQVGNVAVGTDGFTWQTGMIVTRRDTGINEVEDLAGKRWAVPDRASIPDFLFFQALLADRDIEVGEVMEVTGDSSALLAVYNGEADFATATYLPPILPYEERVWQYGVDDPEPWRLLGVAPRRSPLGYVLVNGEPESGGYRLRDARSGIFDTTPGIYGETQILSLSAQIPNETVVLGADFPLSVARTVIATLAEFAASEACGTSLCSADFYGWTGLEPAEDHFYDPLRFLIASGLLEREG